MTKPTAALPEFTFDSLSVGREFSQSTQRLEAAMVRDYAAAVHNPELARAATGLGAEVDDPSIAILFAIPRRVLVKDGRMPPGGVLARQDFELNRPLRLGEEVRTLPRVADKYEKRGRRYVHIRCELRDASGAVIGCVDNHIIWAR